MLQEKATIDAGEQEVPRRPVIRTKDVFQTNVDDGVVGYSDKLLSVVAHFRNNGAPEGFNAQSMAGKSKKGAVALRLFAVIDPDTNTFERVGFKGSRLPCDDSMREHDLHDAGRAFVGRGAFHHA